MVTSAVTVVPVLPASKHMMTKRRKERGECPCWHCYADFPLQPDATLPVASCPSPLTTLSTGMCFMNCASISDVELPSMWGRREGL